MGVSQSRLVLSQFAKPALQVGSPHPVVTQGAMAFAKEHVFLPHAPQLSGVSSRDSQPGSAVQSPYPMSH
jgi:hypothetical protein